MAKVADKKLLDSKLRAQALACYVAYPLRVAKQAAIRAAAKAMRDGLVTYEKLLASIEAFRGSDDVQQKLREGKHRFIPHAATWINAGRYDDEAPPTATKLQQGFFTQDQAEGVWRVLTRWFGVDEDGDRCAYLRTMTQINEYSIDWVDVSIEFSVPRWRITVQPKNADDYSCAKAQTAINELLEKWKT